MKKKLSILTASLVIASLGFAQELTSKKGEAYLPVEGDWAIGVDVAPFLEYLGNAFNGNVGNASPTFDFTDGGLTVYGKWYRADDLAWRGRLRFLGVNNNTDIAFINDAVSAGAQVEDSKTTSQFQTTLGFGMEKRKGKTRLQGFYGGEALITYGSSSEAYTYGNAAATGQNTDWNTGNINGTARLKDRDNGSFYYVGVRPFIGVEFFIMPKISLGGEFGYTIAFGGSTASEETWESATGASTTSKGNANGSVTFLADNDNLNGNIKLLFHF